MRDGGGHGSWFDRWFTGLYGFGFLGGLFDASIGGHCVG